MSTPTTKDFLYRYPSKQARMRLFCFPYAGGGASIYRTWTKNMPPNIEVCPVQLPGRENRISMSAFTNISPLVDYLVLVLAPYLDMPYAFFGHSMGALISFELAQYIHTHKCASDPIHLFVSGRRAPHLPTSHPPMYQLPDQEFTARLRSMHGTSEAVLQHKELFQLILPLLRADFTLCDTYTYNPTQQPLSANITAFGGVSDEDVPLTCLTAWEQHTTATFKISRYTGNHFFLHENQVKLCQEVQSDLYPLLL